MAATTLYPWQRPVATTPSSTGSAPPTAQAPPSARTGPPVQNSNGIPNPAAPRTTPFVPPVGVNSGPVGRPDGGQLADPNARNSFFTGGGSGTDSIFEPAGPASPPPAATPPPNQGQHPPTAPAAPMGPVAANGAYYGPMNAQHYDPAIHGPWEQFHANHQAYQQAHSADSAHGRYQEAQNWQIYDWLDKHPRATEEQFRGFLESDLGLAMQKDQGMARLKSLLMDFNNTINGNYHYDLEKGMKFNVGTSDKGADWEPMTPEEMADVAKGLKGRLADQLGISRFASYARHYPELKYDEQRKLFYDPDPQQGGNVYYNQAGFMVNPNDPNHAIGPHYWDPRSASNQQRFNPDGTAAAAPTTGSPATPTSATPTTPAAATPAPAPAAPVHMPGQGGVNMPAVPQPGTGGYTPPGGAPAPTPVPTPSPTPGQDPAEPPPISGTGNSKGDPQPPPSHPPAPPRIDPKTGLPQAAAPAAPNGLPVAQPPSGTAPVAAPPSTAAPAPGVQPTAPPSGVAPLAVAPPPLPPPPLTAQAVGSVPPGGSLPTDHGELRRKPDGGLEMVLSDVGAAVYNRTMQRLHKSYGPRLFADDPRAPQPEILAGKWNYNPLTGRWVR